MNSASLAIATLVPTLGVAASQTVQLLKSGSATFSDLLQGPKAEPSSAANHTTMADAIKSLGQGLHQRLRETGVSSAYEMLFRMDETGKVSVDVSGDGADQVSELLRNEPSWLENLRKIASSSQLQLIQRGYSQAPEITIGLSESDSWMRA